MICPTSNGWSCWIAKRSWAVSRLIFVRWLGAIRLWLIKIVQKAIFGCKSPCCSIAFYGPYTFIPLRRRHAAKAPAPKCSVTSTGMPRRISSAYVESLPLPGNLSGSYPGPDSGCWELCQGTRVWGREPRLLPYRPVKVDSHLVAPYL